MDAKNHAHTDSYWAPVEGCQFTSPSADAVKSQGGEDNFGCYRAVNPVHRCVSNDDSTPRIVINDMIIRDRESL